MARKVVSNLMVTGTQPTQAVLHGAPEAGGQDAAANSLVFRKGG